MTSQGWVGGAAGDRRHVLLTGGTGFLGSYLAATLLRKGHDVSVLARGHGDVTAVDRLNGVLAWHGVTPLPHPRARVVEGDLGQPGLGLDPDTRRRLAETVDCVIHCASNTSFAERHRESIFAINVDGLGRLLDFTAESACRAFHLISTAYVAGQQQGRCPETLVEGIAFHNVYEESKSRAEWLATERCRALGVPLTIYRPSIVYGDSKTGRTLQFNALYYPVRTAHFLKRTYEADIHERGGEKAAKMGVHLEPDGTLHLPVRLEVVEGGGINIIPVDYFVAAIFAIMEGAPDGGIFHIVNETLTPIEKLVAYTQELLGLSGLRTCLPEACAQEPQSSLERLVSSYLEPYDSYMKDTRVFAVDHAGPILAAQGLACPELSYEMYRRCMSYAIEADWRTALQSL